MAAIPLQWNPSAHHLRWFGVIGLSLLPILAAMAWHRFGVFAALPQGAARPAAWGLLGMAAWCAVGAATWPPLLRPLYVVLTVAFYPIGLIAFHAVMAIVFYGVITPVALVFKLIGRDALHRRFDRSAASYWIRRHPPADVKRYFRQF